MHPAVLLAPRHHSDPRPIALRANNPGQVRPAAPDTGVPFRLPAHGGRHLHKGHSPRRGSDRTRAIHARGAPGEPENLCAGTCPEVTRRLPSTFAGKGRGEELTVVHCGLYFRRHTMVAEPNGYRLDAVERQQRLTTSSAMRNAKFMAHQLVGSSSVTWACLSWTRSA